MAGVMQLQDGLLFPSVTPCCVTSLTSDCSGDDSHTQRSESVLRSYAEQLTNWMREKQTGQDINLNIHIKLYSR